MADPPAAFISRVCGLFLLHVPRPGLQLANIPQTKGNPPQTVRIIFHVVSCQEVRKGKGSVHFNSLFTALVPSIHYTDAHRAFGEVEAKSWLRNLRDKEGQMWSVHAVPMSAPNP